MMGEHRISCKKIVTQMPREEDSVLSFKNYKKQLDVPFVVYADFEAYLEKVDNSNNIISGNMQKHVACAFSYYVKCSFDNSLDRFKIYFGEDSPLVFIDSLIKDLVEIYNNHLKQIVPITSLTDDEKVLHALATNCHICEKDLRGDKVHDHCHLTGKYRGAAHNSCNLIYSVANFVPVFFHNFSSYDCHLFMKELSNFDGDIKVIPLNKELYISLSKFISVGQNETFEIRFLDSFRFMASSLESLANNLNDDNFHVLNKMFAQKEEFNLIRRKGVFPYSYIDSMERFNDEHLPTREKFYNILNNTECSIKDYEHAQTVWSTFNCKNMLDYTKLYLKTDVLLLTDIFENFRKICKNIYKLDPCQYYTSPGLSWDAMLRSTKIELKLLTDINMYNFIQDGIRGGLVQCSKRYSKANNKYLEDYDPNKPSEYLMYLDANNLYGWAMSEHLPSGEFEWVSNELLEVLDVNKISDTSPIGYFLEVDLEYPQSIHDFHNDLPFCAENKAVGDSKYRKLIADLTPKRKYQIHYRVLKQCLKNGLILTKIHRALKFVQSPWLKQYIDLNNYHRTMAKNAFEKDFFKLLNNSVYGKTMENIHKRKNVKIVTEWETTRRNHLGARALISKPNFASITQFSNDMFAVQLKIMNLTYNKPIYLGFTVLELSKWKMYDFHYQYMKPKFSSNLTLNYMDTDSFIYSIKTKDFYEDIREDVALRFDTSEYPNNNIFKIPLLNKKVLGMMKDENKGKIMKEFVGLRSKMYSFQTVGMNEVKKSKGVKMSCLKNFSILDYKKSLFDRQIISDSMNTFRSKFHQLYTQKLYKVVLSYADDKRIIDSDQINTYARGHYRLQNEFDDFFTDREDEVFRNIDDEVIDFLSNSADDDLLMNAVTDDEVMDFLSNSADDDILMNVEI